MQALAGQPHHTADDGAAPSARVRAAPPSGLDSGVVARLTAVVAGSAAVVAGSGGGEARSGKRRRRRLDGSACLWMGSLGLFMGFSFFYFYLINRGGWVTVSFNQ